MHLSSIDTITLLVPAAQTREVLGTEGLCHMGAPEPGSTPGQTSHHPLEVQPSLTLIVIEYVGILFIVDFCIIFTFKNNVLRYYLTTEFLRSPQALCSGQLALLPSLPLRHVRQSVTVTICHGSHVP